MTTTPPRRRPEQGGSLLPAGLTPAPSPSRLLVPGRTQEPDVLICDDCGCLVAAVAATVHDRVCAGRR